MIDALSPSSDPAGAFSASGVPGMGAQDFMTLLLAQLRHQDPMNPMQPHEFASQLASFTSVEQLSQLNTGMTYQLAGMETATILSKTALSAALVGRTILAEGNRVRIAGEGKASVQVDVGGTGGAATLVVLDENGKEVARREVGAVKGGRQTLELPDGLAEGTYTFRVDVKGADGSSVPVTTYVSGLVERVLFEDGSILLRVGGVDVELESLVEIGTPPAASA